MWLMKPGVVVFCEVLWCLHSIQNAAARLVMGTGRCDRISPVLRQLYWLPVQTAPLSSIRRWLDMLQATWLTTAASSPTLVQEDCSQMRLVRFSSCGLGPTLATQPSVQLDLTSGTICRRTSESRTCHIAVSDRRWRHFLVSGTKAQRDPLKMRFRNSTTYLLTYLLTCITHK